MKHYVNAIAARLSLRPPQRRSLEILDRVAEVVPLKQQPDPAEVLAVLRSEFPSLHDFEREFPSLCFALATGVGKTRLMGAFISYLHLAHGIDNFFVLAPNLTIYNKLIADFTPNTPKYVFRGIAEFATDAPEVITGDNYEQRARTLFSDLVACKINIFNISKINSEVRGNKQPRIKRLSEYIGESYFDYLASLPDLVLLMDESHRYRASAGIRAINDLKPILGLELTATPYVEISKGVQRFQNVVYDYPLNSAIADGFVKEPAVVTRANFNPAGMSGEAIERIKLEDGVRLHEKVKVELETYARETSQPIVKPFVLVIARDTTHASQLLALIESAAFFNGHYAGKAIQVDSSKTGAEEEAMIARLLNVEQAEEPTEIVIHVNMLKEGWDVTNLYTIVPLRAANARILIEQSIGRGLRLPYGKRTGLSTIDTLSIVAHDRFQEIIDEARKPGSVIQLKSIVLDDVQLSPTTTVVSQPQLASKLGLLPTSSTFTPGAAAAAFATPAEQQIAQQAYQVIRTLENQPQLVPTIERLNAPELQTAIVQAIEAQQERAQTTLAGFVSTPDIAAIVKKTTELIIQGTIDIPRILVVPTGAVHSGFRPFTLELSFNYLPVSDDLIVQNLRNGQQRVIGISNSSGEEQRLADYIVRGLIDYDDISYDDHADLLYDLAGQTVDYLRAKHSEYDTRKILQVHEKEIVKNIHAQMQAHHWQESGGYEVKISKGFSELKPSAYTHAVNEAPISYRVAPADKSNMAKYLFGDFEKCLYPLQKFASDAERKLAVILEREALRWFKPALGQFQIYYQDGNTQREYQPDFVAETADVIYMLEPKANNQMQATEVLLKRDAAVLWCEQTSAYNQSIGGKPWRYVLIAHDAIAENMTLQGLARLAEQHAKNAL